MKITNPLRFTCCLLVLFYGNAAGRAPTTYEVRGVVSDSESRALQNIVVSLENQARAQVGQTVTDSDGRYLLSNITSGVYYLAVRPNESQYQPIVQRLELIDTGPGYSIEKVDFVLRPSARRGADLIGAAAIFAQPVPPDAEKEYLAAMKNLSSGEKDPAVRHLMRAIEIFPTYFLALQQLGLVFVENEKFEEAIGPLEKASQINHRAAHSLLALGIAHVNLGHRSEAVEALDRARALDAKSFPVNLYLGIALLNVGRLDEAERALKEAYALGGATNASMVHLYLASIYDKRGQYQRAIDEMEAYLREKPNAANAESIRKAIRKLRAKL